MASSRRTATNENVSTYGGSGLGRDYTSLATWEAATDIDLVSAAQSEVLELYNDEVFDDHIDLSGAVSNSSYFRIVRPAGVKGQPSWEGHDGTPNNGVKFISTFDGTQFNLEEEFAQFQDIIVGIDLNSSSTLRVIKIDDGNPNDNAAVVGCITLCDGNVGSGLVAGIEPQPDTGCTVFVIDCLFIDGDRGCDVDGPGTAYVFNCTVRNMANQGYRQNDGTAYFYNCLYDAGGGSAEPWGDGEIGSGDYNASSEAADGPPGGNSLVSQTFTFVNAAGDDYHLASTDTGAIGNGTDLSADANYAFDDDIDFDIRPATWDIGFDQFVASGPENVADVNGILAANISDINGVTYSDINDINGID